MPGDRLIGVPSSGLHTNGYSLARSIVFEHLGLTVDAVVPEVGGRIGDVLLTPHRSYLPLVGPFLGRGLVTGMAHITGGGITDNLPRILPAGTEAVIDLGAWAIPPVFQWLQRSGAVPLVDMLRTFNMGIGLIVVTPASAVDEVLAGLAAAGEPGARVIGAVAAAAGAPRVRYEGSRS